MGDYSSFGGGGAAYPLPASTANSLLKDADPAIYYALDFFANVIQIHSGARISAEASAAGGGLSIPNLPPTQLPYDPFPYLKELQTAAKLPLLAIFRKGGNLTARTVSLQHDEANVTMQYILPPLTAGQAERLIPALKAVKDILHNRGEQGWDPAYTPPGDVLGGKVWKLAGIEYWKAKPYTMGRWEASDSTFFSTISFDVEMGELASATFTTLLAGIDAAIDYQAPDGTKIVDLRDINAARLAPFVTSISPATGTTAGGTSVTITGQNFVVGTTPIVILGANAGIGGAACTSVVVVSTTSITAKTGAHSATVGDVTVVNVDGQNATKTGAFTYA